MFHGQRNPDIRKEQAVILVFVWIALYMFALVQDCYCSAFALGFEKIDQWERITLYLITHRETIGNHCHGQTFNGCAPKENCLSDLQW